MLIKRFHSFNDRIRAVIKGLITILIVPGILVFSTPDIQSAQKKSSTSLTAKAKTSKKKRSSRRRHKRRYYNPSATRVKAIEILRHSEFLSELAGLEPIIGDSSFIFDDSEEAEEIGDFVEEFEDTDNIVEPIEENDGITQEEVQELPVDMDTFRTLWLSYVDDGETDEFTSGGIHKQTFIKHIIDWLGTPYRFGGRTKRATDCSGFIQNICYEVCELNMPRTAREQINVGSEVRRNELEFGDMIFFHTYSYRFASHVGFYLADGLFVHASSRFGVTISSLNQPYYATHLIGARRLNLHDLEQYVSKHDLRASE